MRKVYESKPSSMGLPFAVAVGVTVTSLVFCILPFSQMVNNPSRTLE